tara:strand:- start:5769 stop:5909 length:141 start_codon:yes stop_codon:yes gene_type:complete
METINVSKETKHQFDKEILNLRMSAKRNIFSDEFIQILLNHWRKSK